MCRPSQRCRRQAAGPPPRRLRSAADYGGRSAVTGVVRSWGYSSRPGWQDVGLPRRVGAVLADGQAPVSHYRYPLGAVGDGGVVGDKDERELVVAAEFAEQGDDVVAGVVVEVAGGFVGEQHFGLFGEGAGDCDALLLAAG